MANKPITQVRKLGVMSADPRYSEIWEESDGNARWYDRGRLARNFGNAEQFIEQAKRGEWLVKLEPNI